MDSSPSTLYCIEPLKGAENYASWKLKLEDILTEQGLWDYVNSDANLSPTAAEDDKTKWHKKDRSALSAIRLCVTNQCMVYVASATTAKEVWDTLKEMYQEHSPIGIILVRRKLFQARCDESKSIETHIREMRGYQQGLVTLSKKLSEKDFAITLLTSLPDTWDAFISTIDTTTLESVRNCTATMLSATRCQTRVNTHPVASSI